MDCLGGQWWAHSLDLGYLLPQEHVQSTVSNIFTQNHTDSFKPGIYDMYILFLQHSQLYCHSLNS